MSEKNANQRSRETLAEWKQVLLAKKEELAKDWQTLESMERDLDTREGKNVLDDSVRVIVPCAKCKKPLVVNNPTLHLSGYQHWSCSD